MMAELRQIVRIANVDLNGAKAVGHQLTKIKGVGTSFSNMICRILTIPKEKKAGELSDEEIKRIEGVIAKPLEYGAPLWMINRRNDPETGTDMHIVMSDLKFLTENDIKLMKKIKSWKGVRHMLGQPVRGQRTKSNFRRNKGKVVAVVKKKVEPAAAKEA